MKSIESELIVVGFGPAGLGAILRAHQAGYKNIYVVDPSPNRGSGGLDGVQIESNSPGNDFTLPYVQALLQSPDEDLYQRILNAPEAAPLHGAGSPVPLTQAAEFLRHVAEVFVAEGIVHHIQEDAAKIVITSDGYRVITSSQASNVPAQTIEAPHIIFAPGGEEVILTELLESRSADKVFTSRDILSHNERFDELCEHFSRTPSLYDRPNVAVVGGSHGAYSTIDELLKVLPLGARINIYKKSPTRPFFESIEDAESHGYLVGDHDDVCPDSGNVNRWDGVRGTARTVWCEQQKGGHNLRDHYIPLSNIPPHIPVVQATGYTPRKLALVNEMGVALDYEVRPAEGEFASVHVGNIPLRGAFAVGIGHSGRDGTNVYPQQAGEALALIRL